MSDAAASPTLPSCGVRIGISGWRYPPWRGVFYPEGLAQHRELAYASRAFNTIEINGSFYGLLRPKDYLAWVADTPDDFLFSVKAPRYITHIRRLADPRGPIANFLASGVLALGPKLGPMLWQLPPSLHYEPDVVEDFLAFLPHHTDGALTLARDHDPFMAGRTALDVTHRGVLHHVMEVRHASFACREFVEQLRRHRVALVVADTAGKWPLIEEPTSDVMYLRLHGDKELYASGYDDEALDAWAERIRVWHAGGQVDDARQVSGLPPLRAVGRLVCCHFDNDIKVRAPFDAARLMKRLGLPSPLSAEGDRFDIPGFEARPRKAPVKKRKAPEE